MSVFVENPPLKCNLIPVCFHLLFSVYGSPLLKVGEVGNAARMMLILNMVQGSFMATIAEGLTLAQATGQSQQTFLDILCQGQMASSFVDQKCQSMFPVE